MSKEYVFHEYDSEVAELNQNDPMTERYAGETKLGLWGPLLRSLGPTLSGASCSLDKPIAEGDIYYIRSTNTFAVVEWLLVQEIIVEHWRSIDKKADVRSTFSLKQVKIWLDNGEWKKVDKIPKLEDMTYHDPSDDGPNYEEQAPPGLDSSGRREYKANKMKEYYPEQTPEKVMWVEQVVKVALKIVNLNLIALGKRVRQRSERNPLRDNIILQSEAVSLFKGNFIRLMKQNFTHREISVIRSAMVFSLNIDQKDTISWVRFDWNEDRDYYHHLKAIMVKAFKFTTLDYAILSKEAIDEWNEKNPAPYIPAKIPADVDFSSIKKIKF